MHDLRLLLAAGILCAAVLPARGQDASPPRANGTLRVFLDCQTRGCDFDHFRREIPVVDWVRDRQDADVHVLVTRQGAGGGGSVYTITFIGLRDYAGSEYTVRHVTDPDDTQLEDRDGFTRALQLGLGPLLAGTPAGRRVQVSYADAAATGPMQPEHDPWDHWVFRVSGDGSIGLRSDQEDWRGNGGVSASRVTEEFKLIAEARGRGERSVERYETDQGPDTTITTRSSWIAEGLAVWSLGPHWSAGALAEVYGDNSINTQLAVRGGPAIEYNVFPYTESTRRALTVRYAIGGAVYDYLEYVADSVLSQTLPLHVLAIDLGIQEPWGSMRAGVEAFQYLHDLSKHSLGLDGRLSIRVFRGLDFNVGGSVSRVRDQIYIPLEQFTLEEILTGQFERGTSYRVNFGTGLSYRFGSKLNNVVNTRF